MNETRKSFKDGNHRRYAVVPRGGPRAHRGDSQCVFPTYGLPFPRRVTCKNPKKPLNLEEHGVATRAWSSRHPNGRRSAFFSLGDSPDSVSDRALAQTPQSIPSI